MNWRKSEDVKMLTRFFGDPLPEGIELNCGCHFKVARIIHEKHEIKYYCFLPYFCKYYYQSHRGSCRDKGVEAVFIDNWKDPRYHIMGANGRYKDSINTGDYTLEELRKLRPGSKGVKLPKHKHWEVILRNTRG